MVMDPLDPDGLLDVEIPDLAEPICAYRAFSVDGRGLLTGARGVVWPTDQPLRATHVGSSTTIRLRFGRWWRMLTFHPLRALIPVAIVAVYLWLLFGVWDAGMGGLIGGLIGAALGIGLSGGGDWRHSCTTSPCPPDAPGHPPVLCGIYGYHSIAEVKRRTKPFPGSMFGNWRWRGGQWPVRSAVYARVLMWGRVYEHTAGWRAEYARIEALYGHGPDVERAALRYGVPIEGDGVEEAS